MAVRSEFYKKQLKQVIERIEEALRDGFYPPWNRSGPGAVTEAGNRAVADGSCNTLSTFRRRYLDATRDGLEPDWSYWKPATYQRSHIVRKVAQETLCEAFRPEGKPLKLCVIGDAHDDPRLEDKSRFLWMGKWCKDERPDVIIQLGDWATFDSMSSHAERGSVSQFLQPSWTSDLESLSLSISAFEKGLSGFKPKRKIITEGNHEYRAARYENSKPEMVGALTQQWRSLFRASRWRIVDFGTFHFEDGVGFIHHPINGAGKAFCGETGNRRAGTSSVFPIVHGHDHRLERVSVAKIGPNSVPVEVISAGCSLPFGHVEEYAKVSTNGWSWCVNSMTILGGRIIDMNSVSMLTLEDRYKD